MLALVVALGATPSSPERPTCEQDVLRCLQVLRDGSPSERDRVRFALRNTAPEVLVPRLVAVLKDPEERSLHRDAGEMLMSASDSPEVAQLKVDHGICGGEGIRQQPLESFQLLLSADDGAFLILQFIEQIVTLAPELRELALHASPVPIELE